jgi:hypothetical protein
VIFESSSSRCTRLQVVARIARCDMRVRECR